MNPTRAVPSAALSASSRMPLVALITALLCAAGLLVAPGAWASSAPGQAWVRAAHAIPGLEGMTFSVTGGPDGASVDLVDDAAYGTVSDYKALAPGDYTASVAPAGEPDAKPVLSTSFTVGPSSATTLAAIGTTGSPRLATLSDDLTPPAAGTASVRILPAASGAPTVAVKAEDGPTIADAAVFGQATPYAAVPAGSWTLDLVAGDKTSKGTVDLAAGSVYTVVVVDGKDGALAVLPVTDAAGTSQPGAEGGSTPGAAAPVGGVQTGDGGTATSFVGADPSSSLASVAGLLMAVAGLALGGVLLVRRRARS